MNFTTRATTDTKRCSANLRLPSPKIRKDTPRQSVGSSTVLDSARNNITHHHCTLLELHYFHYHHHHQRASTALGIFRFATDLHHFQSHHLQQQPPATPTLHTPLPIPLTLVVVAGGAGGAGGGSELVLGLEEECVSVINTNATTTNVNG